MTRKFASLLIAAALAASFIFADDRPREIVKVGLLTNVASFNLAGDDYKIFEMRSQTDARFRKGDDYFVTVSRGRVVIDGKSYSSPLRIVAADGGFIRINGKKYRDSALILTDGTRMTVINELGIDNYVRGVLAAEMSRDWPLEALKAQAVAARGFVWKNSGRHAKDGFDVCPTVHCQVYIGAEGETEPTDEAVAATSGEILFDGKGDPVNTVFHACCGGYTEEPSNVWDVAQSDSLDYLSPKKCGYCAWYKHFTWSAVMDATNIRAKLAAAGYRVGKIKNLEIVGRNVSGRARFIKVTHAGGATALRAGKFRLAVDPWKIRSTKLSAIVRKKDEFEFRGNGWGHGVGMCQAGAKGMADAGRDYRDILGFYYRGSYLKKITD